MDKVIDIKILWLILISHFTHVAYPQTSNEGMLYVSSDTEFSSVSDMRNLVDAEFYNDGQAFIYADFNNEGIVDFYGQTGTTNFIGSAIQEISGSQISRLHNVLFKNIIEEYPFHLSGDIEVYGLVDFNQGIVDVDNYLGSFLFGTNAGHINTSDLSHVDGNVEKYGDTEFVYPIGDKGYYRFAGKSEPGHTRALYRAKYFFEDPNTIYNREAKESHITLIDEKEYWIVHPLTEEENIALTLSWRSVTTPEEIISAAEADQIHIVRWDEDEDLWVDEGGVANLNEQTVTTSIDRFGVFTFAIVQSDSEIACDFEVYNAVTPNGDGINDYLSINLESSPCIDRVQLKVFNRWGVKVFESDDYGVNGDVFDGYSRGRLTTNGQDPLPSGTYFYLMDYQYSLDGKQGQQKKSGYLYLTGN